MEKELVQAIREELGDLRLFREYLVKLDNVGIDDIQDIFFDEASHGIQSDGEKRVYGFNG